MVAVKWMKWLRLDLDISAIEAESCTTWFMWSRKWITAHLPKHAKWIMAWISCLHARLAIRPTKNHLSHRIYWQLRWPAARRSTHSSKQPAGRSLSFSALSSDVRALFLCHFPLKSESEVDFVPITFEHNFHSFVWFCGIDTTQSVDICRRHAAKRQPKSTNYTLCVVCRRRLWNIIRCPHKMACEPRKVFVFFVLVFSAVHTAIRVVTKEIAPNARKDERRNFWFWVPLEHLRSRSNNIYLLSLGNEMSRSRTV